MSLRIESPDPVRTHDPVRKLVFYKPFQDAIEGNLFNFTVFHTQHLLDFTVGQGIISR